jgi:DNA modification methylase
MGGKAVLITAAGGRHSFVNADSRCVDLEDGFDLVLTSPPFFHPERKRSSHGFAPTTDLEQYTDYVSGILVKTAAAVKCNGTVCILKTDVWHRGTLIPLGFKLIEECIKRGLRLRAHWVWQRFHHYSPYAPSFSNIFVLSMLPIPRPPLSGVFSEIHTRRRVTLQNSYTPEVFEILITALTRPGEVILDPFAGVGSVMEAASNTKRWCVGIEISRRQFQRGRKHLSRLIPGVIFHSLVPDQDRGS